VTDQRKYLTALYAFIGVIVLLLAEMAIRFYHWQRWDLSVIDGRPRKIAGLSPVTADADLGWRAKEDYRFEGKKRNADGTEYGVSMVQDENGFRMFGDVNSNKPKILIIGDSDTHATEVSDDKTYYGILKQSLDVEIFAYGVRGYGSLQQWMVLNRYYDLIKPDLVLWQYSIDDLIDNSPGLNIGHPTDNHEMPRPYWIDGAIRYVLPKPDVGLRYCRICRAVANRLDKLARRVSIKVVEAEVAADKFADMDLLKSVETTDQIMELVARRVHPSPVLAFITGTGDSRQGPKLEKVLVEISHRHKIIVFDQVEKEVVAAEETGAIVKADDNYHWNELGHRLVGEALANSLTQIWRPHG
jgi:hypothetical protein